MRALIGAERLRELHRDALVRYHCWQCGRSGRTAEPTSVLVLRYREFCAVELAHANCADSRIVDVSAARWALDGAPSNPPAAAGLKSRPTASPRPEPSGKAIPGMRSTRLARKIGLDGNPLRRRIDKVAACLAALLVAVFLAGAPLLSLVAARWAGHAGAAEQREARSWHQVPAVLQQAAAPPRFGRGSFGSSEVLARWTAPDGQVLAGAIPVSGAMAAGHTVLLWVNAVGSPTGPPPSHLVVLTRQVVAAVAAAVALAIMLLFLTWAGRWALDRRRLRRWEAAWAAVGPDWTRHFRSRG